MLEVILLDLSSARIDRRRAVKVVLRVMEKMSSKEAVRDAQSMLIAATNSSDCSPILHRLSDLCNDYKSVVRDSLYRAIRVEGDVVNIADYCNLLLILEGPSVPLAECLIALIGDRIGVAGSLFHNDSFLRFVEIVLVEFIAAIQRRKEYGRILLDRNSATEQLSDLEFVEVDSSYMISLQGLKALLFLLSKGALAPQIMGITPTLKSALSNCSSRAFTCMEPAVAMVTAMSDLSITSVLNNVPFSRMLHVLNDHLSSVSDAYLDDFIKRLSSTNDGYGIHQVLKDSGITDLSYMHSCLKSYDSSIYSQEVEQSDSIITTKEEIIEPLSSAPMELTFPHDLGCISSLDENLLNVGSTIINILEQAQAKNINGIHYIFQLIESSRCKNKSLLVVITTKACINQGYGDQLIDYMFHSQTESLKTSVLRSVLETFFNSENAVLGKLISRSLSRIDIQNVQLTFLFAYGACRVLAQRKFSSWREIIGSLLDFLLVVEGDFDDMEMDLLAPLSRSNVAGEIPFLLVKIISGGRMLLFSIDDNEVLDRDILESFVGFVIYKLLRKKEMKNFSYFGIMVMRSVAYRLYLKEPEVIKQIIGHTIFCNQQLRH